MGVAGAGVAVRWTGDGATGATAATGALAVTDGPSVASRRARRAGAGAGKQIPLAGDPIPAAQARAAVAAVVRELRGNEQYDRMLGEGREVHG